jgi:hypothetical protein
MSAPQLGQTSGSMQALIRPGGNREPFVTGSVDTPAGGSCRSMF